METKDFKYYLRAVLYSPYIQFVVGLIMFFSSFAGQQGTLYTDLLEFKLKIHHGVNLMGLWQILQSLPNLWDSVTWMLNKWLREN